MDRYRPKSNVIFDDINLSHYNAFAFGCNLFDRPERDVDIVSVPGRQGDLVLDNGRYKNIAREYQVQVTGIKNIETLIQELTKKVGYFRLEDDYDSEVYFEARLAEPPTIKRFVGEAASVTVRFDRKPQRYLKSGDNTPISDYTYIGSWETANTIAGTVKMVINNPYGFETYPLIIIPGGQPKYAWRAWLQIKDTDYASASSAAFNDSNAVAFYIAKNLDVSSYKTEVDSEKRSFVSIGSNVPSDNVVIIYNFPTLKPGVNYFYLTVANMRNVSLDIDFTKIKAPIIYPRWWTI